MFINSDFAEREEDCQLKEADNFRRASSMLKFLVQVLLYLKNPAFGGAFSII